ncbi:MAG TPA: RluA family pseudouridine synthase [Desulfobacterales bacterium]|nr:RluA family pseudouridine synthase [Desulfobacterales bacterium]HIP40503.1 RluA family pseudouridine synthase [Desulfocapsa sulfexigens]
MNYSYPATVSPLSPSGTVTLLVSAEQAGIRLDHFLVQFIPDSSRSNLVQSIRLGLIQVDGKKKKSSYRLKAGELVSGTLFQAPPLELVAQEVPFDILFEDDSILILSKPPGIVVHPANGNPDGTLVNGLLYHCQALAEVGDHIRPGIVHRLDKDTSGIMVVAKTSQSHRLLVDAFKARTVDKEYLTIVFGIPEQRKGRIVKPIGRHPVHRQKMTVCDEKKGRYAASNWQVLEEYTEEGCSLVKVCIETGRTHQIRVHMASLGHPVAGDSLYGRARNTRKFPRQMLHAYRLSLYHPITGEKLTFTAPLWADFQEIVDQLRMLQYNEVLPLS